MAGFEYYIVFGNNKEGATADDYTKFGEALNKHGLELKLIGAPLGVSEDRVLLIKGPVSGYEKFIGDNEILAMSPITNQKTITVWVPDS